MEEMTLAEYLEQYAKKGQKVTMRAAATAVSLEDQLARQIANAGLPTPQREYYFHPKRRWRVDFAWPEYQVAAEVNGGTWVNGRHNRPSHINKEYEKLNHLALDGWLTFLFSTDMVQNGTAVQYLIDYFKDVR